MPSETEAEIKANYKAQHDSLSESYYAGDSSLTKEQFDLQHGKIWDDMEVEFIVRGYRPRPEPPRSTHISTIDAIDTTKARPVRIKRVWEGRDYFFDCYVTETVKDQFVAGVVKVGDYVLIHFDEIGEQIVTAKVFKSW